MEALPDDVLPLLAAGSNRTLARLRVSRRFAAVCAVPPLERRGDVYRRGAFTFDMSTKYDANVWAPVLDCHDMAVLSEIIGADKVGIRAFTAKSVCVRPTIGKSYFGGARNAAVDIGESRVYFMRGEIKFRHRLCRNVTHFSLDVNGPQADYYLVVDGVYWAGYAYAVEWMGKQVESTMLTVVYL